MHLKLEDQKFKTILFIYKLLYQNLMVTANWEYTIDTHTKKKKNLNTMLKLVNRSQEKRTKEEGRKKTYKNKSKMTETMATGTGAALYLVCLVAQWCPTLCNPMNCSQAPLSMGSLQARILELVAMPSSRGSSTQVSHIAGGFFTIWAQHRSPRILKWVAYPFSKGSSQPNKELGSPALQTDSLPAELPGKPLTIYFPLNHTC